MGNKLKSKWKMTSNTPKTKETTLKVSNITAKSSQIIFVTDFGEMWHRILSFLSIKQKNYAEQQGHNHNYNAATADNKSMTERT